MDGLMLACEIRKLPSATMMPLVLLTSMGVRQDNPGFAEAAFASCLTKPIKPAQLHEVLARVISAAEGSAEKNPPVRPSWIQNFPSASRYACCFAMTNVINQKVAMRLLQQMGYKPDVTANGLEALGAIDRQPYDLVFMDLMMPEMDGIEATRAIRERQRNRKRHPNYNRR